MIIRKQYRVEMGHIVRNCSSDRCAHSMHGHSAIIEVLLEGTHLDRAGMLYDFGLMKTTIKQFIDAFDHCYVFWDKDDPEYIASIKKFCDRWVSLPFNPTAEMLSLMFMNAINKILKLTLKRNGESPDMHIAVWRTMKLCGTRRTSTASYSVRLWTRKCQLISIMYCSIMRLMHHLLRSNR